MSLVRKAVIPIAGLGSRFLPATKCVPKEMLPIYDRPAIEYIIRELVDSGVEEVIFVISPEGSITPKYFSEHKKLEDELRKKGKKEYADQIQELSKLVRIKTVVQQEPKGDGHAILQAKFLVGEEDFFAFFGDEILDSELTAPKQLLDARGEKDSCVLGVQTVPEADISKFGIVDIKEEDPNIPFRIHGFVEKPLIHEAPSNLALLGKNLCSFHIFDALQKCTGGKDGELRLVDAFIFLQKQEPIVGTVLSGKRFDVGNPRGLLEASVYFSEKREKIL
jgi:UTP--glucose-1-phosphate uridylyltransferase